MENRKTVGERLLERVNARDRLSPRLSLQGSRFTDRFARYGRTGSLARIGNFFEPQAHVALAERSHDDPALISSAPYWARLQRLGNARLRREQRLAALAERAQGRAKLSAVARLPDVRPKSLPFLGLAGLIADQFEVLAPLPAPMDPEMLSAMAELQASVPGQGITPNVSHLSPREFVSAKVIRESGKRPLQRIQERAPAPRRAVAAVKQAISRRIERLPAEEAAVLPRQVRGVATKIEPLTRTGATPPEEQQISGPSTTRQMSRRIWRSMKGRANPIRSVAVDYEAALPDDFLPPTRHAQGRLNTGRSGTKRGLRTALSRTPLMASLEPMQPSTAPTEGPASHARPLGQPTQRLGQPTQRVGGTTARRMAHRAGPEKTSLLSSSPVRRPALMAPSAVTLEPAFMPRQEAWTDESIHRPVQAAPMVRAMERSRITPTQLIERPLSERQPVATRPVRTRSGQFAPEATVLTPGIDPVSVTEDAQPEQAERLAARATASTHAVQRLAQPEAVEPSPVVEPQHRPNRIARTRQGSYAPESTVLAPAMESAVEHAVAREAKAAAASPSQTPRLKDVSERLDAAPAAVSAPQRRRARGLPQIEDAAVLAPTPKPEEELSQGQHAADRLQRVPVVGQSTTKVAKRMTQRAEAQSTGSIEPVQRRVAPRLFKSPLSHIRVMRSVKAARPNFAANTARERLVLRTADTEALPAATPEREAQRAGQERVEAAWQQAGRPLDWTDARIEVIQVPMMVGAAQDEREAPRTERTTAGEYVPVRTGQTRAPTTRPSTEGVTLARSETVEMPDGSGLQEGAGRPLSGDLRQTEGPQQDASGPRQRTGAWRSGFDATMGRVQSGAVHKDLPVWAQRSTGRPRITGTDDLVQQLATASAPEDVVQVLMGSGDAVRRATSSLPQPVIQVIQQIKTEAVRAEGEAHREQRQDRTALPTETVRGRASRREGARSTTRVARSMTGLNPRGSASGASGPAMGKVTQLAKRLQELIAMAESQKRSGARQQVRMAEDSSAAKAEGQAAPTSAETGRDASADIDTLAREVIEQVTRELEMRRERRQEDPDGRSIWW